MRKKEILRMRWYVERSKFRRTWKRIAQVLACITVFCTTYALMLPAITLEMEPFCGIENHEHTESCYEPLPDSAQQQASVLIHRHDALCFDIAGTLLCPLEEIEEHQHSDSCYETVIIHQEQESEPEQQIQAQEPAAPAHVHDAACYEMQRGEQTCALEESEEHVHEDACFHMTEVCICGIAIPEGQSAAETEQAEQQTQLPENNPEESKETEPVVTETRVLVCKKPEYTVHSHSESCYELNDAAQKVLVCSMSEIAAHQHSESCLCVSEEMLCCDVADEMHQHTYQCYTTWTLVCEFCGPIDGPQKDADLEKAQDWERAFANLNLTEFWPEDVLAIAQTQLGYEESQKNYEEDAGGSRRGYTRFGQWWGDPYGEWNSMFAAFCLHYAGVEEYPLQNTTGGWIEQLKNIGAYAMQSDYLPKAGDLIFLDSDRTEPFAESEEEVSQMVVDRMGIVTELVPPSESEPAIIRIMEGDRNGQVEQVSYELDTPRIIGYGKLPDAKAGTFTCGMLMHSHCWLCYDAEGTVVCGQEEHTHTADCKARSLTYEDEFLTAELKIKNMTDLPENLTMQVLQVTREEEPESYSAMYTAVGDSTLESPFFVSDAVFYRMELQTENGEYTLPEEAELELEVTLLKPVFDPEVIGEDNLLRTFALTEETTEEPAPEEMEQDQQQDQDEYAAVPMMLMATAVDDEIPEELPEEPQSTENYRATETNVNSAQSETITIRAQNTTTFGVALTATTQEGTFWKRVTSTGELTADGVYLIISAEGHYALTRAGTNGTKVYVDAVKGNTDYYEITESDGDEITNNAMLWTFSGSGSSFTIRNRAYNSYFVDLTNDVIRQETTGGWRPVRADALNLDYVSQVRSWRLRDDNYRLTNSGSTSFGRSNTTNHTSTMLIFKQVDTTLSIPDDVVTAPGIGGGTERPEKPSYDPYLGVSGSRADNTSHEGVQGKYASDAATSQLESRFTGDTTDDGRVLTDKSVIYGGDDYGAYASYAPNTFGVTLSALGQEFLTTRQTTIATPVDVMFILDVSGSMNSNTVDSQGTTRTEAMVDAVNFSIKEIMDQNPNNRVGAVLYSSGTGDLLEMGRYEHPSDKYLKISDSQKSWSPSSGYTLKGYFVELNSGLTKDGQSYNHSVYEYQLNGTYTQAGIALGTQKLQAIPKDDTTCVVKAFEGTDMETEVKVQRQPVIILLSDGEPTHCTPNYKDVLSGPHYGDGQASSDYKGVNGYYTILSANYYKRMVGNHYGTPALFYSIGMGISADGDEGESNVDGAVYKRAVLNPTAANIGRDSRIDPTNTTTQMRNLLNNNYSGQTIQTTINSQVYMPSWMGQVHQYIPVLKNPYAGNYSYADNAYFGNYDTNSLKGIFGEILEASFTVSPYGFMLRSSTPLQMQDPIGYGMELVSDPVLRFGGRNYTHTDKIESDDGKLIRYQYNYFYNANDGSGDFADLSQIVVRVVTDDNGLQTVHLDIPDYILPAYSPYSQSVDPETLDPYFYYESLPARLIYQVGMTEESQAAVAELADYGGELEFYTNRYEDTIAHAYLLPTNNNPFYAVEPDEQPEHHDGCHHESKVANVTGTYANSFECHHSNVSHTANGVTELVPAITQKLGNNGWLSFSSPRRVIDIPVEKKWINNEQGPAGATVDIELYSVVGDTITLVETMTLGHDNQWTGVFERLPLLEEGGFYALRELVPKGFAVSYSGEIIEITLDGKPTKVVKIQGQDPVLEELVTVSNSHAYRLPNTGGMGTQYHAFGGLLLMAAAAWMYYQKSVDQRKRGGRYER